MSSAPDELLDQRVLVNEVLLTLKALKVEHRELSAAVHSINGRLDTLAGLQSVQDTADSRNGLANTRNNLRMRSQLDHDQDTHNLAMEIPVSPSLPVDDDHLDTQRPAPNIRAARRPISTSRIILTTYPGQSGIDPLNMSWGHESPTQRGPVVVSRNQSTIRRRNGRLSKPPFSHERRR